MQGRFVEPFRSFASELPTLPVNPYRMDGRSRPNEGTTRSHHRFSNLKDCGQLLSRHRGIRKDRDRGIARISHRFLLNGYNWLDDKELWGLAKYGLFLRRCSAETSKRQAREAVLSLRSAWSRARARSRRGSRSALPRIASRICETSGIEGKVGRGTLCGAFVLASGYFQPISGMFSFPFKRVEADTMR